MSVIPVAGLRHGLVLEAASRFGDDAGSATVSWTPVAIIWAAMRPASGREVIDADGVSARVTHDIHIRWRADVTAAMRFRDGARVYLIRAVRDVDDRRRRLACSVEEQAL